jgi:hypothetical protein
MLPGPGCGVGMVFTSGGELVEERRRARWVGGSSWEDAMVRLM